MISSDSKTETHRPILVWGLYSITKMSSRKVYANYYLLSVTFRVILIMSHQQFRPTRHPSTHVPRLTHLTRLAHFPRLGHDMCPMTHISPSPQASPMLDTSHEISHTIHIRSHTLHDSHTIRPIICLRFVNRLRCVRYVDCAICIV